MIVTLAGHVSTQVFVIHPIPKPAVVALPQVAPSPAQAHPREIPVTTQKAAPVHPGLPLVEPAAKPVMEAHKLVPMAVLLGVRRATPKPVATPQHQLHPLWPRPQTEHPIPVFPLSLSPGMQSPPGEKSAVAQPIEVMKFA